MPAQFLVSELNGSVERGEVADVGLLEDGEDGGGDGLELAVERGKGGEGGGKGRRFLSRAGGEFASIGGLPSGRDDVKRGFLFGADC